MKFSIKHEINGRVRIHVFQRGVMSMRQADLLQYYLETLPGVLNAKVYERTADAVIVIKVTEWRSWKESGPFLMIMRN